MMEFVFLFCVVAALGCGLVFIVAVFTQLFNRNSWLKRKVEGFFEADFDDEE